MIVTLDVIGTFVWKYEQIISPGSSVKITNFQIASKTEYDHGDYKCILQLIGESTIEPISKICPQFFFIPSTTIKLLLLSIEKYTAGTIGAIVVAVKRTTLHYILNIKDGETKHDSAQVNNKYHIQKNIAYYFLKKSFCITYISNK